MLMFVAQLVLLSIKLVLEIIHYVNYSLCIMIFIINKIFKIVCNYGICAYYWTFHINCKLNIL